MKNLSNDITSRLSIVFMANIALAPLSTPLVITVQISWRLVKTWCAPWTWERAANVITGSHLCRDLLFRVYEYCGATTQL